MEFNSPAHTRHFGLQTRRKDAHLVSSNLRREMFIENILDEIKRERGVLKPLLHSVAHTPSPPQLHEMSPVQGTAAYIWDSTAKIKEL